MKTILNTFKKETLFFDDNVVEKKIEKNPYFFNCFLKMK